MIIYIELFILINILISIITLVIIHTIMFIKYSKLFFLGQVINVLYMFLYIYSHEISFYIKCIVPIVIVILSFKTSLYFYIKSIIIYYLISFVLGGSGLLITISGNIKYFIILILILFFLLICHLFFKRKRIEIFYMIKFKFLNKEYKLNAFFDTGCDIFYKFNPVIILNEKYKFNISPVDTIKISSGIATEEVDIFYIDKLYINKKIISVYCIFLDIHYNAIIGYDVL